MTHEITIQHKFKPGDTVYFVRSMTAWKNVKLPPTPCDACGGTKRVELPNGKTYTCPACKNKRNSKSVPTYKYEIITRLIDRVHIMHDIDIQPKNNRTSIVCYTTSGYSYNEADIFASEAEANAKIEEYKANEQIY